MRHPNQFVPMPIIIIIIIININYDDDKNKHILYSRGKLQCDKPQTFARSMIVSDTKSQDLVFRSDL